MNWYVHCGCDGHGDHEGCTKRCRDHGCAHPVGVTITAPTEGEATAADGLPPSREALTLAAYVAINRIQSKAEKKIARLHHLILSQGAPS